jgi:glutamate synthase (NADPH/NADH) small chain
VAHSKSVAVVGGGNVAMDAARTAKRMGAEHVYLVYRRTREEMPARLEEVHHAEEEGIEFLLLHNPVRYEGDADGRVTKAVLQKMVLGEPDASGRRKPVPVEEYVDLPVDTAVVAIGNGPNPLVPRTTPGLKTKKWGNILAEKATGKTSLKAVWAGGDIVLGAATVILAMGAGRAAARSIDEYLKTGVWTEPVLDS